MEIDLAVFAQDSVQDDAEESVATQLQRALSIYVSSSSQGRALRRYGLGIIGFRLKAKTITRPGIRASWQPLSL